MISGIAFDRPDRLRMFPYDRFKIYTIVSIVRIDLNSIHSIEVVSIVWIVCDLRITFPYDRLDRLNIIWDDWDEKPRLKPRLRCRRSYVKSLILNECMTLLTLTPL